MRTFKNKFVDICKRIYRKAVSQKKEDINAIDSYGFQINGELLIVNAYDKDGIILYHVEFPMAYIFWGGRITIYIPVHRDFFNRFLWYYPLTEKEFQCTGEWKAKGGKEGILCAYTNTNDNALYLYLFTTPEQIYKKFVHLTTKKAKIRLSREKLIIRLKYCIYSEKRTDLSPEDFKLVINSNIMIPLKCHLEENKRGSSRIRLMITADKLIEKESEINNPICIRGKINDIPLTFNIGKKNKRIKETKRYYIPSSGFYYRDFALFVRQNINGNYTLVIRKKTEIEYEHNFQRLESRASSFALYHIGKLIRFFNKKNINLYFEKDSAKADEGTWEIFEKALFSDNSRNYFILDKKSDTWKKLSGYKNVVPKYSGKYYFLLYSSDYLISTETSSHLNVHRAINPYVRRALIERPLIFLQHGITYLKRQGNTSVFGKGKEGEPYYMIVGSDKEKKVVCEMLKLEEKQCVKTGLPIFSTIRYEHITNQSSNIVTIMLTWRPSEEYLIDHFERSFYFKKIAKLYNIVCKYLRKENVRIVPHPKVLQMMKETELSDRIWNQSVFAALEDTKLLITDYSSVCYNAFYQGAGILFFQPDREEYEEEVGKLIPTDEEYIGRRTYDFNSFEIQIKEGIREGIIDLGYYRNEEFRRRYMEINEFHDGKNVDRIVEFLKDKRIV